jgi:hypothetical protein
VIDVTFFVRWLCQAAPIGLGFRSHIRPLSASFARPRVCPHLPHGRLSQIQRPLALRAHQAAVKWWNLRVDGLGLRRRTAVGNWFGTDTGPQRTHEAFDATSSASGCLGINREGDLKVSIREGPPCAGFIAAKRLAATRQPPTTKLRRGFGCRTWRARPAEVALGGRTLR